jgi:hypothetical protein
MIPIGLAFASVYAFVLLRFGFLALIMTSICSHLLCWRFPGRSISLSLVRGDRRGAARDRGTDRGMGLSRGSERTRHLGQLRFGELVRRCLRIP